MGDIQKINVPFEFDIDLITQRVMKHVEESLKRQINKGVNEYVREYIKSTVAERISRENLQAKTDLIINENIAQTVKENAIRYVTYGIHKTYPALKINGTPTGEALYTAIASYCGYQDLLKDEDFKLAVLESAAKLVAKDILKREKKDDLK